MELWKTPWDFKYFGTVFHFLCPVFRNTKAEGAGGHIFKSRLRERGTPGVARGAIATAREEGDRKCRGVNGMNAPRWALAYKIPPKENGTSVRRTHYYSHLTDENIESWHPSSHTQHNWGVSLHLSGGEAQAFLSTPYVQISHPAPTSSQGPSCTSIKPLNLYRRFCLQQSHISSSCFCFERQYIFQFKLENRSQYSVSNAAWSSENVPGTGCRNHGFMIFPHGYLYFGDCLWKIYTDLISLGSIVLSLGF